MRTQRPILLAVDQQLGEGAALRVAPELSDPVGPLEVGEHQDVEQLGVACGAEGVEAFSDSALELIRAHSVLSLGRNQRHQRHDEGCATSLQVARTRLWVKCSCVLAVSFATTAGSRTSDPGSSPPI
jgi:hypothetical protein